MSKDLDNIMLFLANLHRFILISEFCDSIKEVYAG